MLDFFFSAEPGRIVGTVANAVICAVGVLAVAELVRARVRVRADMGRLHAFTDSSSQGLDRAGILSFGTSLPHDDLIGRRIRILHELHKRGADVDPDSLAALGVAEMDRSLRFARWASTTVVLLGLGGTLVGLSMAVVSAGPMLQDLVAGPDAIKAVTETFSGLGTAFSTTLMGIVWAMASGFGLILVRAAQGAYLQRVEEVSMVHLYPNFRTSPANAMVESARLLAALEKKLADELTAVVEQLRLRGSALTKMVEDSISELTTQTENSGNRIRSEVENSMTALRQEFRDDWSELLRLSQSTQESLASLIGVPTRKLQPMIRSIEALEDGTAAMQRSAGTLVDLAPSLREVITAHVDRQTDIIESSVQQVSQGLPAFQKSLLHRMRRQEVRLANTLALAQRGVIEALGQQRQENTALREVASKLKEGMDSARDRGLIDSQMSERLSQAVDALTQATMRLSTQSMGNRTGFERVSEGNGPPSRASTAERPGRVDSTTTEVPALDHHGTPSGTAAVLPPAPSPRFWDRITRRSR